MKRYSKSTGILTLLCAVLFLWGCDQSPMQVTGENPYAYVGELHNQGLDYIAERLPEEVASLSNEAASLPNGATLLTRREDLLWKATKKLTADFMRQHIKSAAGAKTLDRVLAMFGPGSPKGTSYAKTDEAEALTEEQQKYVDKISRAVQETRSIKKLRDRLHQINADIKQNLSEEEAKIPLMGSAVALHSAEYWRDNRVKWIDAVAHTMSDDVVYQPAAEQASNALRVTGPTDGPMAASSAFGCEPGTQAVVTNWYVRNDGTLVIDVDCMPTVQMKSFFDNDGTSPSICGGNGSVFSQWWNRVSYRRNSDIKGAIEGGVLGMAGGTGGIGIGAATGAAYKSVKAAIDQVSTCIF